MFDLVGLHVRDSRSKVVLTVLRREKPWGKDVGVLVHCLRPMTIVGSHPKHPTTIIISGEYTVDQVKACIGDGEPFELEKVVGMDNPALPFAAPTL